jgi:hypothetical protein
LACQATLRLLLRTHSLTTKFAADGFAHVIHA